MAVVTWNGSSSTDFATAANWDTGSVPTASDDVIIPDTSSINKCVLDQARNINSFVLAADGEFDAGDTLFIKGKNAAGEAVKAQGKLGDVTDFTIETASAATIRLTKQSGSGSFRNLTISHASGDITLTASMNLSGNLTITQGKLRCNGATVEVTGKTTVGPNSGAADQATLQCDASAMFLGINKTDDYALEIKRGGTYDGGTGNHQSGAVKVTTDDNAAAKLDFTSANHTIKSEYTSEDRFFELTSGTVTHSNGTIILDSAVTSAIQWLGPAGDAGPYDLKLDDTGMTVKPRNTLTVLHDLTILAGTFNTQYDGSDKNLIVNGDILLHPSASAGTDAPSTLICNSSDITVGGKLETQGTFYSGGGNYTPKSVFTGGTGTHSYQGINFLVGSDVTLSAGVTSITGAVNGAGAGVALRLEVQSGYNTYSNGSGTVKFTSSNDQHLYSTGQQADNWTQFHNLILEKTSSTLQGLTTVGFHIKVGADLTITSGILNTNTTNATNHALTVTGELSIAGTLTGNASAITIGKMLEITNGGTYTETSGTTLISGQPDGDYVLRNHDGGTYTKNATGILKIARTSSSGTKYAKFGEDVYNDVILENTSSGSVVAIVGVMNLAGDLTVVEGELRSYGGTGAIDIDGDVSIENGGKFSTATTQLAAGGVNADFGSLTIASGGEYDATPLTTTITTGAFDITTTSFDLGASTLVFSGTNASFLSATNATFSAGPGATITGKAADDKTDFDCQENFQVVGTVENLNNNGPGSLMVTGQVINCDGNIIQLKPTQDSEQQLDKSSEADRETTLGRDLDGNTELVG